MTYTEQYLLVLIAVLGFLALKYYLLVRKAAMREHYMAEALVALAKNEATISIRNNLIEIVKHGDQHETSKQD